jgi:hypothetical protein
MSELEHFEIVGDHAEYRPTGQVTLLQCVKLVASAIACAREQQQPNLLVIMLGLTGFRPPDIATRYFFIKEWARAAGGVVRVAMVVRREMIDPQKFGVIVAANSGLIAEVFESEKEALSWLKSLE